MGERRCTLASWGATGSHQNPHFYVYVSHQTMLPVYKLKELQGLKPLQEGVSLGLGTKVSVISVVYEIRWPQEVTLTSLMSHPTPTGHNTLVNTPFLSVWYVVCLHLIQIDRNWKWRQKQTCVLQKLLHHLQQIIAQVYQRGSESANPQAFQETDLRDSWDSECPKPEHKIWKAYLLCTGGREKTESKVKAHMLLASVCYH